MKHVIDGFNEWQQRFAREWGERNDIRVILDQVILGSLADQVAAEAAEQRGHDLVNVMRTGPAYEDQAQDLQSGFTIRIYKRCMKNVNAATVSRCSNWLKN